jgi:hypothetical protein
MAWTPEASRRVSPCRGVIILDGPGPVRRAEADAGEMDEAVEVALPEVLRGGVAAGPEVADPAGDRAVVPGCHGTHPGVPKCTATSASV